MISRMHELIEDNSQFIIATHSPIIMAYPNAVIYEIKEDIRQVEYKDTEHYQIMKGLINNPEGMLNILIRNK